MDDPRQPFWPDADVPEEDDEDLLRDRFLTFRLGDDAYGLAVRNVIEIVVVQPITDVPDVPEYVRGVINLRGQVLPVIDLRSRFRLPDREYDERTCVVVTELRKTLVGLIVDRVEDVLRIAEADISAPPRLTRAPAGRCLQGVGRTDAGVVLLLDADQLIFGEDLHQLARAGTTDEDTA